MNAPRKLIPTKRKRQPDGSYLVVLDTRQPVFLPTILGEVRRDPVNKAFWRAYLPASWAVYDGPDRIEADPGTTYKSSTAAALALSGTVEDRFLRAKTDADGEVEGPGNSWTWYRKIAKRTTAFWWCGGWRTVADAESRGAPGDPAHLRAYAANLPDRCPGWAVFNIDEDPEIEACAGQDGCCNAPYVHKGVAYDGDAFRAVVDQAREALSALRAGSPRKARRFLEDFLRGPGE